MKYITIYDKNHGKLVLTKTHLHELTFTSDFPFSLNLKQLKKQNGRRPTRVRIRSLVGDWAIVSIASKPTTGEYRIGCRELTKEDFKRVMRAADEL